MKFAHAKKIVDIYAYSYHNFVEQMISEKAILTATMCIYNRGDIYDKNR